MGTYLHKTCVWIGICVRVYRWLQQRERKEIAKSALVSSCKREQSIYVFVPKGGLMYVHEWLGGREREREREREGIKQ